LPNIVIKIAGSCARWADIYLDGINRFLLRAAPRCSGRMLDVGCGSKPYKGIFSPFVREYVGIEHSGTLNETHDVHNAAADFFYDGGQLPFTDESFDVVMSISVLEHTPQPEMLFKEMARVLKVGGIMIQHVPFSFRLHEEPHDYYRFTPHVLGRFCADSGMEMIELAPQGTLWSVIGHKLVTMLVFKVARMGAIAQRLGKLGMERTQNQNCRYWTLVFVAPLVVIIVAWTRLFEKLCPVEGDSLAFCMIATKKTS